jgi:glycosyltransferase involved in cell wall biosynthesis
MQKPKIAVLIDWYLPGTKAGGPVRSVYSLVNLLKEEFDFYIITTNLDLGSGIPYAGIEPDTLFTKQDIHYYYFSASKLSSKNVLKVLQEINPRLIYLNSFWSVNFSINIVRLVNRNLISQPVLLAPRGMLGKGALSIKAFKKQVYLGMAKFFGWYGRVKFHATQAQETGDIKRQFKNAEIEIAPNINSLSPGINVSKKIKGTLRLFFLSRISPVKNLNFALEVLASITSDYVIDYHIYGNKEDQHYWKLCEKTIDKLPPHISVSYRGELAFDKIQETISNYHCLFMPTLNENYGHSIVESLLCGCPVIISDQTPWSDLQAFNAGYAISLAHKDAFINAVIQMAEMGDTEFEKKSQAATSFIINKTNLPLIINQYKKLFNDCIQNRSVHL